ncbi:NAD(P)/FAD-dependent oxidoreductase [Hyphobacterium sp.]|uniref:NAD(P)/FAD-dependent oxidoreductase n=1 Tax=Hyphobacterium sp. TaxID=2004662 RepID=UPI00374A5B5F
MATENNYRLRVDAIIIGGGVVGLACARALALQGREVIVLEQAPRLGAGTTSRNSGVIHAGLYYPPQSLKARLCVKGRRALYGFLRERSVPFTRHGKLVLAQNAVQADALIALKENAHLSGCEGLELVASSWLERHEPNVKALMALSSPDTGWVDVHALIDAFDADIGTSGGLVFCNSPVERVEQTPSGFDVLCKSQGGVIECKTLVLAAGLGFDRLLAASAIDLAKPIAEQVWAKGSYFSYAGASPFKRHIYPVPVEGGLGIHATLDGAGRVKFGPDVEWLPDTCSENIDYGVEALRRDSFVEAIVQYWPDIDREKLHPDHSGVRPKLAGAGQGFADFGIFGPEYHSVPGLMCLTGIESPGLTASLAIGDEVYERLNTD